MVTIDTLIEEIIDKEDYLYNLPRYLVDTETFDVSHLYKLGDIIYDLDAGLHLVLRAIRKKHITLELICADESKVHLLDEFHAKLPQFEKLNFIRNHNISWAKFVRRLIHKKTNLVYGLP